MAASQCQSQNEQAYITLKKVFTVMTMAITSSTNNVLVSIAALKDNLTAQLNLTKESNFWFRAAAGKEHTHSFDLTCNQPDCRKRSGGVCLL